MLDIQQLTAELSLIEGRRKQIRAALLKHWNEVGSYNSGGYYIAKVQSITQEVFNTTAVANCLPRLINDNQHPEYYRHFLDRISVRGLNSAVLSLPIAPELTALVESYDEDGGKVEVIGKPRKVIVTYEPATGKREGSQHILEPGDTPLAGTTPTDGQIEDDEDGEYSESLSPGD